MLARNLFLYLGWDGGSVSHCLLFSLDFSVFFLFDWFLLSTWEPILPLFFYTNVHLIWGSKAIQHRGSLYNVIWVKKRAISEVHWVSQQEFRIKVIGKTSFFGEHPSIDRGLHECDGMLVVWVLLHFRSQSFSYWTARTRWEVRWTARFWSSKFMKV